MLFLRLIFGLLLLTASLQATPANRAAFDKYYDRFLSKELNRCSTCHLPSNKQNPESLEEFPHNPFGDQLRRLRQSNVTGGRKELPSRLAELADRDADQDGVGNELEILAGTNPGDASEKPSTLAEAVKQRSVFAEFLKSYRWQPFETVTRPPLPKPQNESFILNPVDAFIAAGHEAKGLTPRPEAPRALLLRRVYLDLIGLNPTIEEQRAFDRDRSDRAYEKVVDRLLADPRYGERWGRHWMDVWRYSDWAGWSGGNQIRDSQPHIWRWRDWIVDSLNEDKGYDQMIREMLAADELDPENPKALAATGFLVRNYKMLSREQWLEDTVKHTSQAFLGMTVGCAKCHNHMTDPISQKEYYQMRAIFEPHQVRIDRIPGQVDTAKNGLPRAYDTDTNAPTYLFVRGDERRPDTNQLMEPGVPSSLLGRSAAPLPTATKLPALAYSPDHRPFVRDDLRAASREEVEKESTALMKLTNATPAKTELQQIRVELAKARLQALESVLKAEELELAFSRDSDRWKNVATNTLIFQRQVALLEGRLKLRQETELETDAERKAEEFATKLVAAKEEEKQKIEKDLEKARKTVEEAKKKTAEARKQLTTAEQAILEPATNHFKARTVGVFPAKSSGRRTAFAQWLSSPLNPLTARVAVNHLWLRHFGRGLVSTPADFGRTGQAPSHPELLDWLAAELMQRGWSLKDLHRVMVTSSTYRMASTGHEGNSTIDPDNVYLWRMPSRRMEAELVRDNLLFASAALDLTQGGPEIDHKQGMSSRRRSLYMRQAAEKEVEFLKIFDGPSVTECYQRRPSVMPQQALALGNSELAIKMAGQLAALLDQTDENGFIDQAFRRVLARAPAEAELAVCLEFLQARPEQKVAGNSELILASSPASGKTRNSRRENLLLVLFNHNDFVTIR